jgi:lathosterol oxidase
MSESARARRRWLGPLGWMTGVASVVLGAAGVGAVLCLWYPALLTTPALREVYDMRLIRGVIKAGLIAAFVLGAASLLLKRRKALGLTGIGLAALATLMGGSAVEVATPVRRSDYLGLDWFLINLLILATVFVPLESVFARLPAQRVFRRGWTTDLAHFAVSHLMVQASVLLTLAPAAVFFRWAVSPAIQNAVAAQPIVPAIRGDSAHRRSHAVRDAPALPPRALALALPSGAPLEPRHGLAGRLAPASGRHRRHPGGGLRPRLRAGLRAGADLCVPRLRVLPGHPHHANVSFAFGPLRWLLATPQFHHWHHAAESEAVDKNFAVHLPVIDWVFGTFYLPGRRWPARYGLEGDPVPEGYGRQLVYPFLRGPSLRRR